MSTPTPNDSLSMNRGPTETIPVRSVPEFSAATFFSWVTASQRLEEWLRWMPYVCRDRSGTCDLPAFPELFCGHGDLPWPCGALGEDGDDGSLGLATETLVRNMEWIGHAVESAAMPLTVLLPDQQLDVAPLYEPRNAPEARTWTGALLPPTRRCPTAHETAIYWYRGLIDVLRLAHTPAAMSGLSRYVGDSASPPVHPIEVFAEIQWNGGVAHELLSHIKREQRVLANAYMPSLWWPEWFAEHLSDLWSQSILKQLDDNLPPVHWVIIETLSTNDGLTTEELARQSHQSKGRTLSAALTQLQQLGLILPGKRGRYADGYRRTEFARALMEFRHGRRARERAGW